MPAQINATTTLDSIEDEILYTQAALEADPNAAPLSATTEPWMPMVDQVRVTMRTSRAEVMRTDARRQVANGRLDDVCTRFGDELLLAVRKDTSDRRWQQFFKVPVSRFVRSRLTAQVDAVKGWLTAKDEVLERYRNELTTWASAAGEALVATAATSNTRGRAWMMREQLAEDLTRERDALHEALAAVAREKNLGRKWPDLFFRPSRHSETVDAPPPPATVG